MTARALSVLLAAWTIPGPASDNVFSEEYFGSMYIGYGAMMVCRQMGTILSSAQPHAEPAARSKWALS